MNNSATTSTDKMKTIKDLLADVKKELDICISAEHRVLLLSKKEGILDATASFRAMLDEHCEFVYTEHEKSRHINSSDFEKLKAQLPDSEEECFCDCHNKTGQGWVHCKDCEKEENSHNLTCTNSEGKGGK